MSARLRTVIETDIDRRGSGEVWDPIRRVTQYWSTEGELLAEVDPGRRGALLLVRGTLCTQCGGTGWWRNPGDTEPKVAPCQRCCADLHESWIAAHKDEARHG